MESSQILSNCQCNMTKQLEKKLQFLWNVDGYIKDAEAERGILSRGHRSTRHGLELKQT
jgi:hypothetical protein